MPGCLDRGHGIASDGMEPEILTARAVSLVTLRRDADEAGVLAGDRRDEDAVGGAPMDGAARREQG